ncbi:DedA family protein [Nodosilinea sp. E11]|uniref:DedA family protein n=1 Tax=Nodosilinea sp. E11 TaxID=3037479 RepID=UPI00293411BD|nr:DedA family protein [Nodosilinea sp. E11]WOD40222.1 DedA family protein [Nodosilinea sp. E11]
MFNWIVTWIESLGYAGIFGLMVLEHLFPPIPSELVMPLAGFVSSNSTQMNLAGVILAGTLGSLVGASAWYGVGLLISHDQLMGWVKRYGRWLTIKPQDLEKAIDFFKNSGGSWVVGVGRVVPGIRTYVSVPAGLSHMPLLPYLGYSALGTALWTGALAAAGYGLGDRFEQVQHFIGPVSKVVLISGAIALGIWLIKRYRRQPKV